MLDLHAPQKLRRPVTSSIPCSRIHSAQFQQILQEATLSILPQLLLIGAMIRHGLPALPQSAFGPSTLQSSPVDCVAMPLNSQNPNSKMQLVACGMDRTCL